MNKAIKELVRLFTPPIVIKMVRKILGIKVKIPLKLIPKGVIVDSFSQQGEDLVVDAILHNLKNGFYVDIGAFDPDELSNTKRFYLRGWRGINVEPQPNRFSNFMHQRERDINLNCGIHHLRSALTFYQLGSETLSTFDKEQADKSAARYNVEIVKAYKIEVYSLAEIFEKYLPPTQTIDFISIDTEGNEINVLSGNNWVKYRPKLVLIEFGDKYLEVDKYLKEKSYELIFMNNTNGIYLDLNTTSR